MQIKTIMSYHFAPFRMAVNKKTESTKCYSGCGTKESLIHFGVNINKYYLKGWNWLKTKKKQAELPYDPAILYTM